ncbi:MAG: ABC transporter permease subunit [Tannerella sp.]|jgi:ABC-type transport system involved in multi-copper enzyme maturation permease subunit|nr:ABC transporter permease subunit [Tannerella sp.]
MIWFIAKKEFRNNIVTPGFIVGLLLCLALIPYTVYTGIQTHRNRLAQYEVDVKAAEDVYMKSHTYAQVNPLLVKPVSPLSIFSQGIIEQTGSRVKLDRKEKPVFSAAIVSLNENPFMSRFISLDFAMAIAILLSLLGILFSYDMLPREKEQGTLKLALSNPISRSTFFLGKIAGIFLTLLPILALCFLVILLILQFSPSVQFSAGDYGRICALLLLCLVYFAFFVFLGGFISSRAKSATSSIILNLFIWCFLLFLLPNVAAWSGKIISPTDDYKQITFNIAQIDKQWWEVQLKEVEETLKNENLNLDGYLYCWDYGWDGAHATIFTPRGSMEYERRKKELANPILLDNCDKKWSIQSGYLQQIYRQEKTVRYLSCLSPAGILRQIAASLCRTGMDSEVHFMDQARQFQDVFYGYFVQNKIFSSYAYFTPQKEADFPNDWDESHAQEDSWQKEAKPTSTFDFSSYAYQDTQSFPRFVYAQPTLGDDLYEQLYLITGILIACILLFWLSFLSFTRYDVR